MLLTLMMIQPARKNEQMIPTNLILFSKFLITIAYYNLSVTLYRIIVPMAPVAVIFACCATPSP